MARKIQRSKLLRLNHYVIHHEAQTEALQNALAAFFDKLGFTVIDREDELTPLTDAEWEAFKADNTHVFVDDTVIASTGETE